ncbi:MAG: hypothetical protein JNJ69_12330 [Leptospiraceae bacterium]|nr:hypothetical protein [Leptospiraceae bacterium]
MKTLISILSVLTIVTSVSAQKGKKPVAKAPVTQASAPVPSASTPVVAKTADDKSFHISIWGGYGIATKSDYLKGRETIFSNLTGATNLSVTTKNGGIAGGADFFYGTSFQFGASVGYLQGHDVTRNLSFDSGSGPTAYKVTAKMNYVPILLSVRYFLISGLYVGAGVGIASVMDGAEKSTPSINLANGNAYDVKFTGSATVLQGRLGYDYSVSSNFSIGVAGVFTYVMAELEGGKLKDNQDLVLEKFSNNFLNIAPAVALTLKF